MKNILIIMILISFGCNAKKKVNPSNLLQRNLTSTRYIQIGESAYNRHFVKNDEIRFFSGELNNFFDQSTIITNTSVNKVREIIKEESNNLKDSLKQERIIIEAVFDKRGEIEAVSFRLPKKLRIMELNLQSIASKMKSTIKSNIENMGEGRKYTLYTYIITSKNLDLEN